MAALNKIQLIGHVGQSPKSTLTKENHPVASVSLATNESFKRHGEWETTTEWHHLVFFGKLATFAGGVAANLRNFRTVFNHSRTL